MIHLNKIKIITDSCSDLTKEMREKYDIDYVKMNTVISGKEQPASLDWEYYSPKEFYDIMRNGERITTTQVPEKEFEEKFTYWLEAGYDIIYIGCSLALSGSVNMGEITAKRLREKYPDSQIYCINSLNACSGEGLLSIRAAKHRDSGLSTDELAEKIISERNNINQFCTVHSLDTLRRAGRVKASAAFFGNLLGVKPIIISDTEGNNTPIKKVKGRVNSLSEIVELTAAAIADSDDKLIIIAHADSSDDAQTLKEMINERIPDAETYTCYIGPIIGASIGPDAVALLSFGKDVSRFNI